MKKMLLIFIIFCPFVANADNKDTKYIWSYGALAETMKEMRNDCEITHKDEFLEMGNWFRNKAATFSMNEFIYQCEHQNKKFSEINREYKDKNGNTKKCEMPLPCNGTICSEKQFTNNKGCNIFLTEFIKKNNLRANILQNKTPGTYVKKVLLTSGRTAYQIVDVILADGYWKNNKIDNSVNNDIDNTKIYDISTGNIVDIGIHTWTNDMFFDVSAGRTVRGDVRGAFVNSYILPDIDLTNEIYALYDKRRGKMDNTVRNAIDSWTDGDFDIKATYASKYKIKPQTDTESQTNGVMFNGKIAHLDWLGHFLYGMNREESIMPAGLANAAAQGLSRISGGNPEPLNMQNAWNIGSTLITENKLKRITTFAKTQTKTEQEAYDKAAAEMRTIYPGVQYVSCTGNCNKRPGTDDVVICTDSNGHRLEFVFDDICN